MSDAEKILLLHASTKTDPLKQQLIAWMSDKLNRLEFDVYYTDIDKAIQDLKNTKQKFLSDILAQSGTLLSDAFTTAATLTTAPLSSYFKAPGASIKDIFGFINAITVYCTQKNIKCAEIARLEETLANIKLLNLIYDFADITGQGQTGDLTINLQTGKIDIKNWSTVDTITQNLIDKICQLIYIRHLFLFETSSGTRINAFLDYLKDLITGGIRLVPVFLPVKIILEQPYINFYTPLFLIMKIQRFIQLIAFERLILQNHFFLKKIMT